MRASCFADDLLQIGDPFYVNVLSLTELHSRAPSLLLRLHLDLLLNHNLHHLHLRLLFLLGRVRPRLLDVYVELLHLSLFHGFKHQIILLYAYGKSLRIQVELSLLMGKFDYTRYHSPRNHRNSLNPHLHLHRF